MDNDRVFALEDGYLIQDIDLSKYSDKIDRGHAELVINGEMKSSNGNASDGHPYIHCLIIGTADAPDRINTYVNTEYVLSTTWQKVQRRVSIPEHSTSIRLLLKKTAFAGSNATSRYAFFNSVSIKILDRIQ